jgi:hypothetical protein
MKRTMRDDVLVQNLADGERCSNPQSMSARKGPGEGAYPPACCTRISYLDTIVVLGRVPSMGNAGQMRRLPVSLTKHQERVGHAPT